MTMIFESANLRARLVPGKDATRLVITFSSFGKPAAIDRPGFGENFLGDEGVAAIHVVAKGNRWFQYPELPAMIAAISKTSEQYSRVISYGSSMGGFAALRYGGDCGADVGLAISPQFSLDRREVPFEIRWKREAARIKSWFPSCKPLAKQVIVYDPRHALDAQHYETFKRRANVIPLRVPHGGHPAGGVLAQAGLLKGLVLDVLSADFDPRSYEVTLRGVRVQNSQYLFTVARRLKPYHSRLRLILAEMALSRDTSPHVYSFTAECLEAVGRTQEAEIAHLHAIRTGDGDALRRFGRFLMTARRYHEAARVIDGAIEASPDSLARRLLRWRLRIRHPFSGGVAGAAKAWKRYPYAEGRATSRIRRR
ncbi:tetratricopeptide repeat protein [Sphingobium indicum]|uniref:tetratricopeptide repeat protein n=1 Tax=Sphingobium indicum TaxID=332055 RepID=UPI000F68C46B|nr:hypothetical protein [Sphingobium indicum]